MYEEIICGQSITAFIDYKGDKTYFWKDVWCGEAALKDVYPNPYALDSEKKLFSNGESGKLCRQQIYMELELVS